MDEDDEIYGEYEYEDDAWQNEEENESLPCPNCGKEVYEYAEQCPYCGEYITFSTSPWSNRSLLWIVLGVLGTLAAIVASIYVG